MAKSQDTETLGARIARLRREKGLTQAELARVRDECVALLGPVGEGVVQKHYLRARSDIERGAGPEALEDAVQQIARAAGILKGSAVAEAVLRLLKG